MNIVNVILFKVSVSQKKVDHKTCDTLYEQYKKDNQTYEKYLRRVKVYFFKIIVGFFPIGGVVNGIDQTEEF